MILSWIKQNNPFEVRKLVHAYKSLKATSEGKTVLKHVIMLSGMYNKTSSADPITLAYTAGRRDVGLDILKMLNLTEEEQEALMKQLNEEI